MIRRREASPVEVVESHIRRIESVNPRINAFVTTTFDRALDEARGAERLMAEGGQLGRLHGVPVSIKDAIEVEGVRTVGGSRLFEQYKPVRDASSVARLRDAGAIVLGKTNVPEFSLDYRCEKPVFGRTSTPWDLGRVPGGSSGGEAAAIAAGSSPVGIGADLGGLLRVPAHFCGTVCLKARPGRVPGSGQIRPTAYP